MISWVISASCESGATWISSRAGYATKAGSVGLERARKIGMRTAGRGRRRDGSIPAHSPRVERAIGPRAVYDGGGGAAHHRAITRRIGLSSRREAPLLSRRKMRWHFAHMHAAEATYPPSPPSSASCVPLDHQGILRQSSSDSISDAVKTSAFERQFKLLFYFPPLNLAHGLGMPCRFRLAHAQSGLHNHPSHPRTSSKREQVMRVSTWRVPAASSSRMDS